MGAFLIGGACAGWRGDCAGATFGPPPATTYYKTLCSGCSEGKCKDVFLPTQSRARTTFRPEPKQRHVAAPWVRALLDELPGKENGKTRAMLIGLLSYPPPQPTEAWTAAALLRRSLRAARCPGKRNNHETLD